MKKEYITPVVEVFETDTEATILNGSDSDFNTDPIDADSNQENDDSEESLSKPGLPGWGRGNGKDLSYGFPLWGRGDSEIDYEF